MTKWVAKWVVVWTLISVLALVLTAVGCGFIWCELWFLEQAVWAVMTLWVVTISFAVSYAVVRAIVVALARAVQNDKKRPS